jgi:hypothetical protein
MYTTTTEHKMYKYEITENGKVLTVIESKTEYTEAAKKEMLKLCGIKKGQMRLIK